MSRNLSPKTYHLKPAGGFTLVELMIYVGLTAIIMGLFGAILITVTRITGQQNSSSRVTSEMNFLMTTLKRNIHSTIYIESLSAAQLVLVRNTSTTPVTTTIAYDSSNRRVTIAETGSPVASAISTPNVRIDNLIFTKLQSSINPSSTVIRVTITASASTTDPKAAVTRTLSATASPFLQSQ